MTSGEKEELSELRKEMDLHSLGDKPTSIAANKLRRLIELERIESLDGYLDNQIKDDSIY